MAIITRVFAKSRNPFTGRFNEAWYEYNDRNLTVQRLGITSWFPADPENDPAGLGTRTDVDDVVHSNAKFIITPSGGVETEFSASKGQSAQHNLSPGFLDMHLIDGVLRVGGALGISWHWGDGT